MKFCVIILLVFASLAGCVHTPAEPPLITDNSGNPLPPCDPDVIYFANEVLPLLTSNCAIPGCHDPGSAQEGVILSDYNSIMTTADVQPFNAGGSDLYEVITENDPDDRMPPAGAYPPLAPEEIQIIYEWIMQGALNNACAQDCDTNNVTYNNQIGPLMDAKCMGCHSGGAPQGGILLTNYSTVSSEALTGSLYAAVSHDGTATPMPLNSAKLPDCEIELIRIWIENGAPE